MSMRNTMLIYIDRFRHDRHSRRVLGSVLLVLAIVVSLTVYWQLRLNGIAITNETYCGYEEHVHTDDCYEYTLICELEESEGHTHTDECYEEQQVLVCGMEESEEHTHTDACYETQKVLICKLEESEGHAHTDECYEKTLVCELEEHTHTTDCLVDLEADVEDATVWEATLPELAGDLRTDIVNIAYSQFGYTESTANYTLAEDGTTKMGYTRYGAWYGGLYYGSEYSDWDSLFVAFCLDYAGIAENFTYNSGAYAWSVDLTSLGYYQTVDTYSPSTGDVAFIDTDADGRANVTAVVVSVDKTAQTITVIQGNYTVTDSEGDSIDTVALVTYSTATETVTQNEIIALSAGSEAEITPVILGYANVTYVNVTDVTEEEEVIAEETDSEEVEEVTEEVAEEVTVDETEADETETEEADETEETEEETVLLTATASTDYVTQVTELYDYAMTLTAGDTATAESVWNALMSIWEQIYAEEDAGTLTLTAEEYDNINTLTDEVYYYFVETVGYDRMGVMAVEDSTVTLNGTDYTLVDYTLSLTDGGAYYDSDSDSIYVPLTVSFSDLDVGGSNATAYAIKLPEGVVPNVTLNTALDAKDSKIPFTMTFVLGSDGYYYVIVDFTSAGVQQDVDGTVSFEAVYSGIDSDDTITIEYSDGQTITITSEDIESDGNATYDADVSVKKSSAPYDFTTNSVTYTVTVSSTKGTGGDITLTDLLAATGLTTTKVEIDSVTLNGESVTNYTATLTSAESFTVTLAELGADSEYVITYTIYFGNTSTEVSATLTNIANAEVEDKDIEAEVTNTKYVNTSVVSKSGSYDETTNTITWTITVNQYGANIAGYTFTDSAFADATDLKVNGKTSSTEWTYDSANNTITFGAVTDTNNDSIADSNTNTYTITYTQTVESSTLGTSMTYSNTVSVDGTDIEKTATVTVKDNDLIGDLTKAVSAGTATNGTRVLTWTSTFTVPNNGIAADTVIYDYLGTGSGDVWNYVNAGTTHQWFTYAQITELFDKGLSINGATVDTNDYTFSAYDVTIGAWVDYDTLKDDSTYGNHIFTAYKITFNQAVGSYGEMKLEYSTTADISSVTTERTYWNNIMTGSLSAAASYTEYINVYKTDGKGSTADSTRETTDGTVTWKVYVYVAEGTTGDITIVDTMPSDDVSFASATVAFGSTTLSSITYDGDDWLSSNSNISVTVDTTSNDKMTITIPDTVYSTGGYIIVTYTCKIDTFDTDTSNGTRDHTWYNLQNSATVTIGQNETTVTQTQTVTYTYTEDKSNYIVKDYTYDSINNYLDYYVVVNPGAKDLVTGSDTLDFTDVVTAQYDYATYSWGAVVELITSSVNFYELIELSGDSNNGYYYTVDTTTVYLTDYTDSDLYESGGKVYYKSLLDISWMYDVEYDLKFSQYMNVYHTISATIPDSTAIYVEYSYSWLWLYQTNIGGISTENDLKNEVTIKGVSSVSKEVKEIYVESKVSGSASSGNVFTLTKIDSTSMTTTLSGAEFTIYKYVDGTTDTSTGVTLTTDENGTLTVTNSTITDYAKNTLYYLVESKAPDGYTLDSSTRYYFYWSDSSETTAYDNLKTLLASITLTSNPVDLSLYSGSTYAKNTASTASTTLTITKVSSTHSTNRLAGATYTLQKYDSTSSTWVDVEDSDGDAVTFTTNPLGQFTVSTEDLTGLTYNQAYRLVETTYPTGYYAADSDEDVIYFWWSASDTTSNPEVAPSGWSASHSNDGSSVSSAIDLGSSSKSLTVTNTPIPTTEVTVNKEWVDENGDEIDSSEIPSSAYATFQLYYYLGDGEVTNTGGTISTVPIYFGGNWANYYDNTLSTLTDAGYLEADLPLNQEITIKINITTASANAYIYSNAVAYKYTEYQYSDNVYSGSEAATYQNSPTYLEFTISTNDSDVVFYQITNVNTATSIDKIVMSYTDSKTNTPYTNTYENGAWTDWTDGTTSGGGTGTVNTGVSYSGLVGSGTEYPGTAYTDSSGNTVTVTLPYESTWSYTLSGLPEYVYDYDGNGDYVKFYYYYYFVETSAYGATTNSDGVITSASYSQDTGITADDTERTITVTNTVDSSYTPSVELPETGGAGTTTMYEFGAMLILLSLVGAGASTKTCRNISRTRKSLVEEPHRDGVDPGGTHERLPGMRNRKFVIPRTARKGDTRAGPEDDG